MYDQTVFDTILANPGIVGLDYRNTDDIMSDDVIAYDVITKIFKFSHRFLKKG